jgi:basic amino acid/polyamine antiporter, APA family
MSQSSHGSKDSTGLKKTLGLFQATILGVGLILGAGIYTIIGDVASIAGNAMWLSFIIASIIAILVGLTYAELVSMFPGSAAEYLFSKKAFNNNFLASIIGFLVIFAIISSSATVAVGFSGYLSIFIPSIPSIIFAIMIIVILSVINFWGISESTRINLTFTFIEIFGLVFIIAFAFYGGSIFQANFFEFPTLPNQSNNMWMIFSAAGLVFFAYIGFENIVTLSDETKKPRKVISKALIFSIGITTVIYILIALSTTGLVGWETLSKSDAPLATAAQKASGNFGNFLLSVIGLFATANTVLMLLIASSRMIYGISEHGLSIPKVFSNIHKNRKTPWIAILVVMCASLFLVIILQANVTKIASVSVFSILIVYLLMNVSLIVLRYRRKELERPFSSPLTIKRFPVLAGLAIIFSLILLSQFDEETIKIGLAVVSAILILMFIRYGINRYQR